MTDFTPALRPATAVAHCLASAKRILAVTHMNPDGDAIGSLVAVGHVAKALGADIRLYCETPIPPHLDWLNSPTPIIQSLRELGEWQPDRVIFLDCADEGRAGPEMAAFIASCRAGEPLCRGVKTMCIDHHIANPHFADCNWIDPAMSATGEMVALMAKDLQIPLAGDLGEALYLAIVSDTGSFSFGNTSALSLDLASEIVKNGLDIASFTARYENNWTLERMHLWGELMREVKILCNGKVAVSIVTEEHLRRNNTRATDLEGYASWLRRLAGTKVVLLSRVSKKGTKISLRSSGDIDVQEIASSFGGGGHKAAAGIDMTENPRDAASIILAAVCRAMNESNCRPGGCEI